MEDLTPKIMRQIYIALERMNAPIDLIAAVGSYRDTLDDSDVLQFITDFNETGAIIQPRKKPNLKIVKSDKES